MISNIISKNNNADELEVVEIIKSLCQKYDIPAFSHTVIVEKDARPHSLPEITLGTRSKEPKIILQTLIHEQFHWYAQQSSQYADCIAYLKTKYSDDGEHNKSGTYPNSYWEHVIVCFNTRAYLERLLSKEEIDWIYAEWQAYPTLEAMIIEKRGEIKADLEKFDLNFLERTPLKDGLSESLEMCKTYLSKKVSLIIDQPYGTTHKTTLYEANYGYIPETLAPDGCELDAYFLGSKEPLEKADGVVIAIIHRLDDDDDKLIVVPEGVSMTDAEIDAAVNFREKYFKHEIIR